MKSSEMIVLIPTRGRPKSVKPLVQAWKDTEARCRLYFCVDDDDPDLDEYVEYLEESLLDFDVDWCVEPRLRLAGTLNAAAAMAVTCGYKAIGFMGDDHRPRTPGWDVRFAECLSAGAGVVYGNDLLVGARFPTAVMMTSDIPATLGYYCPPGLVHLCLDLVWKDWGDGLNRITYLDDVIIEHLHPAAQKAQMDAVYHECNSPQQVATDSEAYVSYRDNGALAADLDKLRKLLG